MLNSTLKNIKKSILKNSNFFKNKFIKIFYVIYLEIYDLFSFSRINSHIMELLISGFWISCTYI